LEIFHLFLILISLITIRINLNLLIKFFNFNQLQGYTFNYRNRTSITATHGYDNEDENMRALFMGVGPVFSKFPGQVIPSFSNTEVFNLLTTILNITENAPPNNGTIETMNMFKYYLNI